MNKKIIIAIVLIIVILLLVFLFIHLGKKPAVQPNPSTNNGSTTNVVTKNGEELEIEIPKDYLSVDGKNITSETGMQAKAVAYSYNEEENLTLVNVYLKNNSSANVSKDAVAVISLNDENGNLIARFGGPIESDEDIVPGESIVIKTQFYGDPGVVDSVIVGFENMTPGENYAPVENEEPAKLEEQPVDEEPTEPVVPEEQPVE